MFLFLTKISLKNALNISNVMVQAASAQPSTSGVMVSPRFDFFELFPDDSAVMHRNPEPSLTLTISQNVPTTSVPLLILSDETLLLENAQVPLRDASRMDSQPPFVAWNLCSV